MTKHLEFIRSLPCLCCGRLGAEAHHLLRVPQEYLGPKKGYENLLIPKYNGRGLAMKNPDAFALPLCHKCHMNLHNDGNEKAFFEYLGLSNPAKFALDIFKLSGQYEKALDLIRWQRLGYVPRRKI